MKKITLLLMTMLASLLPAPPALAAPSIQFLNPSGYTAPPPTISDAQDADGFVHLVAWAREIPSQALVEFELQPTGQNAATFTADRVGNDTWEFFMPIPDSLPDGATYTLRARLYSGVPGDADEVANDEMAVEIDQSEIPPPMAETVELSYPDNGDRLGIFVPKGKLPVTVFDYAASEGTEQVRAFYTLSDAGTEPVWEESCGSSTPDDQGFGKVRCTLEEGHQPSDVSAVAIVSNKTSPPAPPNAALDDTGDAHRVLPYLQQPTSVEVVNGNATVDLSTCRTLTALLTDQFNRAVPAANVDVHADGPEDELHFGTRTNAGADTTDTFQPPDNQHVSRENAKRCSDNANLNQQGDHNSPGRDDVKHIESVDGTSNSGAFRFALRSDFAGGTFVQAWADVDDDDLADLAEATGGTQLGWGSPPPPPNLDVFLTPTDANASNGSCVAFEIVARRGGAPFNNANVDVHLQGPDSSVTFCDVEGGGTRRPPESGGHVGDVHEDGTRHAEGETGPAGTFKFGVTSATTGTTQVQIWVDSTDDDVLSGEPSRTATVTWQPPGERSISMDSNRDRVAKGRRVRLFGEISGDPACAAGQPVNIQSKPLRGGRFGTVKSVTTDSEGAYSTRIRMQSSRRFRAVTPADAPCSFARSPVITVRVRQ
ncbi:MAG TPA: hypothetical protein VHI71_08415 [Actinomycetota bacterium]|nr:hypothetical protein [Actinomycetota bacterium]